ncbi:MAG: hypothetical protein B7Z61_13550 [Acidobacteria bacterium 37-71-11]|nr:MAG: hypothetical protein B7Z61_13550 [Acidobacteria bacterium 37-71-11]
MSPRLPRGTRRRRPSPRRRPRSGSRRTSRCLDRSLSPKPRRSRAAPWTPCRRTGSSCTGPEAAWNSCRSGRSRRSRWPGSRHRRSRTWFSISCCKRDLASPGGSNGC